METVACNLCGSEDHRFPWRCRRMVHTLHSSIVQRGSGKYWGDPLSIIEIRYRVAKIGDPGWRNLRRNGLLCSKRTIQPFRQGLH